MSEMSAATEAIAAFGATAATMAAQSEAAAAGAIAAGPALLGPVFGLIGGDFVAAFASAHTSHTTEISRLSSLWASIGAAAITTATAYDVTDSGAAASLGRTGVPA
ncbi:hypothetical protein ERC79_05140 [Rhodococcus sp. ABRD24]|uniref:type VII secretion target n=1 Tax=Rhodococcus sp. ABRD24 TaxID=2507582 RepID=UPI00103EB799|nr:type VII secretion target [Rhodococcus sp. ABRD24]QBJ95410.1 hypothetical protein ERC79_05140 [Rhodococcus sp. ABRD24]